MSGFCFINLRSDGSYHFCLTNVREERRSHLLELLNMAPEDCKIVEINQYFEPDTKTLGIVNLKDGFFDAVFVIAFKTMTVREVIEKVLVAADMTDISYRDVIINARIAKNNYDLEGVSYQHAHYVHSIVTWEDDRAEFTNRHEVRLMKITADLRVSHSAIGEVGRIQMLTTHKDWTFVSSYPGLRSLNSVKTLDRSASLLGFEAAVFIHVTRFVQSMDEHPDVKDRKKEMLKLAARVAEHVELGEFFDESTKENPDYWGFVKGLGGVEGCEQCNPDGKFVVPLWNSFVNLTDAFELATALRLTLSHNPKSTAINWVKAMAVVMTDNANVLVGCRSDFSEEQRTKMLCEAITDCAAQVAKDNLARRSGQ